VVEKAIGEHMNGASLDDAPTKSKRAVGGKQGGISRNGFSKKVENHAAAVALWFGYYNFCRVHQTLRVTPAMEASLSDHVWGIAELVDLLNCY
jgi:hypothetical protein